MSVGRSGGGPAPIDDYNDIVWQEIKTQHADADFSGTSGVEAVDWPTTSRGLDRNEFAELVRIERVFQVQFDLELDAANVGVAPNDVRTEFELSVNESEGSWFLTDQAPFGDEDDPSRDFPNVFDWTTATISEPFLDAGSGYAGGGVTNYTETRREWLIEPHSPMKVGPVLDANDQMRTRIALTASSNSNYNFEARSLMRLGWRIHTQEGVREDFGSPF